jgi:thioredoxin-related protein
MNKRYYILIATLFLVKAGYAQPDIGAHFEQNLTWDQVKEKASKEGKLIFVDCFASWCGPCKQMDRDVYPTEKTGQLLNEKFVSIKIQMDSSGDDDQQVRAMYADAHTIMQKYGVRVFPSFLFFSPEGKILHRDVGYKNPDDFITMVEHALTPETQYYTLLSDYQAGKRDYAGMPEMARVARALGDRKLGDNIADDYVKNYLFRLPNTELFSKDKLSKLLECTDSSGRSGYHLIWSGRTKIDAILGENVAERKILKIIAIEDVAPYLSNPNEVPDWTAMQKALAKKFGRLGELEYRQQRLGYDWGKKYWVDFGRAFIPYYELAGKLNVYHINNISWDLFLHVNDRRALREAIKILEHYKNDNGNSMDTYANLLYKVGDPTSAIHWEEVAVRMEEDIAKREQRIPDAVYKETLDKMRSSEPTWLKSE